MRRLLWYDRFNPYLMNGLSHHYHLGESTVIIRGIRSDFEYLFHFLMKFLWENRIVPPGVLHLGLYCLLMSNK